MSFMPVARGRELEVVGRKERFITGQNHLPMVFKRATKPATALCDGDILCVSPSVIVLKQQG